jgi:hypothetical protein
MVNKEDSRLRISGLVVDRGAGHGIPGLRVEAWDKDLVYNDLVGSAVTDAQGAFQIEFDESYFHELFVHQKPDLYFKVFRENELVRSTEDSTLWNAGAVETKVLIEIEIDESGGTQPRTWLKIDSLAELTQHADEVLERIALIPNGGNLFMIHPFLLLADLGVQLSEQAKAEIIREHPALSALSPTPYHALKENRHPQKLKFRLRGLFERSPL